MMRKLLILLVLAALSACANPEPAALRFVALGDAPYGPQEEVFTPYKALISNVNEADPALVLHVGDTHGHLTCDNALMDELRGFMNVFNAPVLYTPGDNEWTDCHSTDVGTFDPLDRLAYLRKTYFPGSKTLGARRETVQNQRAKGFPENARLMKGNIGFITVHVVGSNNNFSARDRAATNEYFARNTANVAWLEQSFAAFKDTDAIVVALHADMFVPYSGFSKGWQNSSPFQDIGVTLGKQSSALQKPVLLLYGDMHEHKLFQPFPKHRPYLHAMEVYGYPDIKAIEVAVRPGAKKPFVVERVFTP